MKSSFCSFVSSHSPAVSLLSNKVHSECHNASDPFLDWYLFICLFIYDFLLFIDFTTIPCFFHVLDLYPFLGPLFVTSVFFKIIVHIWLIFFFFFSFFFMLAYFFKVLFLLPTAVALLSLTVGPERKVS